TIQGGHAGVEDGTQLRARLNVVEKRCAENFVESGLACLNGVMQAIPARKQEVIKLRSRPVGTRSVAAQCRRKRRMVEAAILVLSDQAVAGQESENAIQRRLMRFACSRKVLDWLRLPGFDEIGNADLGDRGHRAA